MRAVVCILAFVSVLFGSEAEPAGLVTHLFTNWYRVDAGSVVFKVDRTGVDAESLRILKQVKDYYKIQLVEGDSSPERVSVPTGVKLREVLAK